MTLKARVLAVVSMGRRVARAVANAWPAALAIGGPFVAFGAATYCSNDRADQIRYAGTVLQFLGLVLVWKSIASTRRAFRRPSVITAIVEWFRAVRASFRPRNQILITGVGAIGLAGAALSARVIVSATTVEQRLQQLEQELRLLRHDAEARAASIEQRLETTKAEQREQVQQLTSTQAELRRQLEEFAVGDSHLEIVGFVWLVVATFATSIPSELAWLL